MFKTKALAATLAAAVAAGMVCLPVSADDSGIITLSDNSKMKLVTNFDDLKNGLKCSINGDKLFVGAANGAKYFTDISISNENALSGNAWVWKALDGMPDGKYEQIDFSPANLPKPVTDFEGADSIGFWIDCSGLTDDKATLMFLFSEVDYDANGKVVMDTTKTTPTPALTTRRIADTNAKYYIQNTDGTWKELTNTKGNYLHIPGGYKGYVKVPLTTFETCWNTDDIDNKVDLKNVTDFIICHGIWPENVGKTPLTFDNIGFIGDFKTDTPSSVAPSSSTEPSSTAPSSEEPSSVSPSSAAPSKTADNPKTGSQPIAAVIILAAAAAVSGAVLKIKRSK